MYRLPLRAKACPNSLPANDACFVAVPSALRAAAREHGSRPALLLVKSQMRGAELADETGAQRCTKPSVPLSRPPRTGTQREQPPCDATTVVGLNQVHDTLRLVAVRWWRTL